MKTDAGDSRESELIARLTDALKMAYRKHHVGDESIGWNELSDTLANALCEAMGDKAFQAWAKASKQS